MTAQAWDVLHFEGRERPLRSLPLDSLWSETHPRPRFVFRSTGCYRGYVARWIIEDNKLYLTGVDGLVSVDQEAEVPATVGLLFPGAGDRVHAAWFTGELSAPEGNCIRRFERLVFERELRILIDRGVVIGSEVVDTGEAFRREVEAQKREVEARKLRLDQALPAQPDAEGWITCPHCSGRFTLRQKRRWDGERHACGGRINLERSVAD